MKVKWFVTLVLIVGLFLVAMPVNIQATNWWLDAHYDSSLGFADDEALAIQAHMSGRSYLGSIYIVSVLRNWEKNWIIGFSLPYAKVWHMASHGATDLWGRNYLVTAFNERIYGGEIPSLQNVYGGGTMLLAFASSCRSRRTSSLFYMLHNGFIDKGSLSYMGYRNDVGD